MKIDNSVVRRRDRLMDSDKAVALLSSAEYGVLSMVDVNGEAYGLPVSFVFDGDLALYLHCAPEGRKLRAIEHHPQVSFAIVGKTQVIPHKFTTNYESVVLTGEASIINDEDERWLALEMILKKYSPEHIEIGKKYVLASLHRTKIIKLTISSISAKAKNVTP